MPLSGFITQLPTLPVIDRKWIEGDPSTSSYTKEIYVSFIVKNRSDPNVKIHEGTVIAIRDDLSDQDLELYFEIQNFESNVVEIQNKLRNSSVDEVAAETGYSKEDILIIKQITNMNINEYFTGRAAEILESIMNGEFLVSAGLVESDGKCLVSVPANSKAKIVYMNGQNEILYNGVLTVGSDLEQGPYLLAINSGM